MRGIEKELIEFRSDDASPLVTIIGELSAAQRGWVNVEPIVDEDDLRTVPKGGLRRVLSNKGPSIPFATYVPKEPGRKRPTPQSIGLQHPAGPRVVEVLAAAGVDVPERWFVQDQASKRGMVVLVPDGEPAADIAAFMLSAARAVSEVPVRGWWSAVVHRPDQ